MIALSSQGVNKQIDKATNVRLDNCFRASDQQLNSRLEELEKEWDTEKTLELSFASLVLLSTLMGVKSNKKWFYLGGIAAGFMVIHALQGWCPPLSLIRRLGIRTSDEINREKTAMKQIRRDRELAKGLEEEFVLDY